MKKVLSILLIILSFETFSQNPGDTIIVQTFDYSMTYGNAWDGTIRDTIAHFPDDPNITFEKIIMAYSMRCRNGQVNSSGGNSVACGEWDYSCHTYVHDSTRIDSIRHKTISHSITGFNGSSYVYTTSPVYNYFWVTDSIGNLYIDSILSSSDTIVSFGIIAFPGTLNNDIIDTLSTTIAWNPYSYTYDTLGNVINIDTLPIVGSINISELIYYKRYPMAFQIMSFVTPYGIGLDLGAEGKTWYFDMTDYIPVFKGPKRITVSGGGQWQEDMDIKFYFIVGTPVRDVIENQQVWRPQSKSYTAIMSDDSFEPRNVLMNPNATSYKLKTTITGHGQEGEFVPRYHYLNLNGGAQDFVWQLWTECAGNPIYPQGGTWIYDRAGWCPGQASDIREDDITSLVNSGQTHSIDYGLNVASGSSNYWVSSQLISYGQANNALDASVIKILSPTNETKYSRTNPICSKPQVIIQNTGIDILTSLRIKYWINNSTTPQVYNWTGNLNFLEKEEVELPDSPNLWADIDYSSGLDIGEVTTYDHDPKKNKFYVEISNPNNSSDGYAPNNVMSCYFTPPPKYPHNFTFWYKTNNGIINGVSETSWEILNDQGNSIYAGLNLSPNTLYRDTINLNNGCYSLEVYDTDHDGIDFWANNDGSGYLRFRRINPAINPTTGNYELWIKTIEPDFGSFVNHQFTVNNAPTSINDELKNPFDIYPNPTSNSIIAKGTASNNGYIQLDDTFGKTLYKGSIKKGSYNILIDLSDYANGVYFLKVSFKDSRIVRKVLKQ